MYYFAEMLILILLCLLSLTTYGMGQSECNTESEDVSKLLMGLEDDSVIELDGGCHLLTSYVLVHDHSNITLRGSSSNDTILTCLHGIGLVFLNISNLQIENIIIENCSLSNNDLTNALIAVNETIDLFYSADGIQVSILMADINSLRMTYVTIRNNTGIGLLAINIMNESNLSNNVFGNNAPDECIVLFNSLNNNKDQVAGGMFLLYSDYRNKEVDVQPSLTISESLFHDNMYCSLLSEIPLLFTISPTFENFGFTYGGGAGLGLVLSQFHYSVNVTVVQTNFERNLGLLGTLQIQQFQGSRGSNVLFDDCLFEENGFRELEISSNYSSYYTGAAAMILNVPRDRKIITDTRSSSLNSFQFKNTQFLNNRAYICAGIYMVGLNSPVAENEMIIDDCTFRNNIAALSSAVYAFEYKSNGIEPGTNVLIHNIIAENNSNPYNDFKRHRSTIITFSMNVSISGNSTFQGNQASPLVAVSSVFNLIGSISFEGNTGTSGGAILIYSDSYLVLFNNTRVSFINNKVTSFGGAIYVVRTETDYGRMCVLSFNGIDLYCNLFDLACINITNLNIQIIFDGNTAQLGNDIYGDIINNCSWLNYLQSSYESLTGYEILRYISEDQNNNFLFQIQYYSDRAINTDALYLNTLSSEGSSNDNRIKLFPGQMVFLNISAEDRYLHSVPLAITSTTLSGSDSRSQLGLSGYWLLSGNGQENLTQLSVYGSIESNVSVSISDVDATASTILYFELEECPYGLIYDSEECICSPNLLNGRNLDTFRCDASSGNITVPQFFWLGRTPIDDYTLHECIFDYCQNDITTVTFNGEDNINSQCADNRGGILCGECLDGYSVVFGSDRCRECKTDARIIGLIIGFLVAGIMLVLAIVFLNFTVTEGYLNIVIFYANIVQLVIPTLSQYIGHDAASIFIFISWINFEPGVDICLFDGMNALVREGFYLFFPFYIFSLMFIIIYLARRSQKITSLGLQATRGFATLLLLCYSSVERTCFIILSAVTITTQNGNSYVGWYVDPNIKYGSGVHGFMIFVAIVLLLFYIIPFTIILICPPRLMNKTRCGRRITLKFKPILDAFYNPFQEKYTFWIGFRCVIRVFPLAIAGFLSYPGNIFGIAVFIGVFMFLHEVIRPYSSERHNKLEMFFLVNLLLITLGLFYYPQKREYFDEYGSTVYITLLVLLAYAGIVYIGLIHIDILFPKLLPSIKLKLKKGCQCRCCSCCSCCCKDSTENDIDRRYTSINDSLEVPPPPPSTVGVSELREPLLEYGTAELELIKKK